MRIRSSEYSSNFYPEWKICMTYPRVVTAQLLDYDGTVVAGAPLATSFGIMFFDEWDGPGYGTVSMPLSEAGSAELLPGRYVDCLVEGTSRFTFKIEGNPKYAVIERGEEHEQIVTVRGRGWGCVFDETTTEPEYGLTYSFATTWRVFSFASILFPNDTTWAAAVEQAEYLDGVATRDCYSHAQTAPDGLLYPAPIGFPWPTNPFNLSGGVPTANYVDSYWIRTDDQPTWDAAGFYFFRAEFTLADFTGVTFTVTGDNFFTLYLQGVPILGEPISNTDHWMWQGWKDHQMFLPAGTYTIAAVVYNISFDDLGATAPVPQPACPAEGRAAGSYYTNPGGLLTVVFQNGDAVTAPVHILSSDDTWISHYEEEFWPGWTPGQIIQQLIDEAVISGEIAVYGSNTFTADEDSNTEVWRPFDTTYNRPDIPSFAVEVGDSLMSALNQMKELGWIHWHVRPGTLILDIYRARVPSSPTPSATLAHGVNLGALERNATAAYANALLVQWEGGYVEVEDTPAIAAYGTKVRDILSTDATTEDEAISLGETELAKRAQSAYPNIIAVIEPVNATDCPYEAFETGDYVNVPAQSGGTEDVRCLSIRCEQDKDGYAIWTSELNARLDVPQRRQEALLQQIGGRNQVVRGVVA